MARMRPPQGLDSTARGAWQHAVNVLREIGEDPALSRDAVTRYAEACSMAETLRSAWQVQGSPGTLTGPRGRVTVHPLLRSIERAEAQAADLADRLALTPASRGRLGRRVGRPSGGASAADRAAPPRRRLRAVRPDAS
jgi:P27 family predicted phage terminase small subunit